MKMNKTQALYKALPGSWIPYSDGDGPDGYKYAAKVSSWNLVKLDGIYDEKIAMDIARRIESFGTSGGGISDFSRENLYQYFEFVEAKADPDFPQDIICDINPLTFYCRTCHSVQRLARNTGHAPSCKKCHKQMVQLQFAYACECGYAEGVTPMKFGDYLYNPEKSRYVFLRKEGKLLKEEQMVRSCPNCGARITPSNATDKKVFRPQGGKSVNLLDKKMAEVLQTEGADAEKLVLARWLGVVGPEEYRKAVKNSEAYFHPGEEDIDEEKVQMLMAFSNKSREEAIGFLRQASGNAQDVTSMKHRLEEAATFATLPPEKVSLLVSSLAEYYTLRDPESFITLDEAIEKAKETDEILSEDEILDLNRKLHISFVHAAESIQIVNYTYGYTRMGLTPDSARNLLQLKAFKSGQHYRVFSSILDTEGLLFEFDRKAIYDWLVENGLIEDNSDVGDERKAKIWFADKVDARAITHFSDIPSEEIVTKAVYGLLHTISHMFIKSAGINSGISKDSISEIIFPNIPAVFIYPTTLQGVTLGSISGMFETNYKKFLEDALTEFEICTFDPICKERDSGACLGCCFISDVSCDHFNKDLSRAYLFGGEIKTPTGKIVISKGFWK